MWIYLKFGSVFNRILCACMQIKWAQKNQPKLTELENNSEREIVCLFVYILWLFDSCWFLRAFLCCLWHCEPQRWSFSFYIFAKFAVNICAVTYAECWWAGKLIAGAYTTTNSHVNLCIFANLDARCHCSQHVIKTCQFRIYYVFHVCQTPHDAMHFDNNKKKNATYFPVHHAQWTRNTHAVHSIHFIRKKREHSVLQRYRSIWYGRYWNDWMIPKSIAVKLKRTHLISCVMKTKQMK